MLSYKTQQRAHDLLELSGKSCPLGPELHPSFDASPQSNEILLNKGMKY
jgi:hypothetical protein